MYFTADILSYDRLNNNMLQYTFDLSNHSFLEEPLKMVTGKNTVSWEPDYSSPEMLVNFVSGHLCSTYDRPMTPRDVCVVNDLFCKQNDLSIYKKLLKEIESCGNDHEKIFQMWHRNTREGPGTHQIVRDYKS